MKIIKILSVNISDLKGKKKERVESIILDEKGIIGDAHAGDWIRQVSMLGIESIRKFNQLMGKNIQFGEFAENLTTEGMELFNGSVSDRFISNTVELEVTQIGKKCHGGKCVIFKESGDCVMPKEGIFCKVIKGGEIKAGNVFVYHPKA